MELWISHFLSTAKIKAMITFNNAKVAHWIEVLPCKISPTRTGCWLHCDVHSGDLVLFVPMQSQATDDLVLSNATCISPVSNNYGRFKACCIKLSYHWIVTAWMTQVHVLYVLNEIRIHVHMYNVCILIRRLICTLWCWFEEKVITPTFTFNVEILQG